MVHIESQDGDEILSFVPVNQYQSVVISSPEMQNGETYLVYVGGSTNGTMTDGLSTGGTYTYGSQISSFMITSIVTGQSSSMGEGSRPAGGGGRP